jgi:hypothetical protein
MASSIEMHNYQRVPVNEDSFPIYRLPSDLVRHILSFAGPNSREIMAAARGAPQIQGALLGAERDDLLRLPPESMIRGRWGAFVRTNPGADLNTYAYVHRFRGSLDSEIRLNRPLLPDATWNQVAPRETVLEHWSYQEIEQVLVAIEEHKATIFNRCMDYLFQNGFSLTDAGQQRELQDLLDLPLSNRERARRLRDFLQVSRSFRVDGPALSFPFWKRLKDLPGLPPELVRFLIVMLPRLEFDSTELLGDLCSRAALLGNREFLEQVIRTTNWRTLNPSPLDTAFAALCAEGQPLPLIQFLLESKCLTKGGIRDGYRDAAFNAHSQLVRLLIDRPELSKWVLLESWYWSSIPAPVFNVIFPVFLFSGAATVAAIFSGGGPAVIIPTIDGAIACTCFNCCTNPAPCWTRRCFFNTTPCTERGREIHKIISEKLFGPPLQRMG